MVNALRDAPILIPFDTEFSCWTSLIFAPSPLDTTMLHVIAQIEIQPGKRNAFLEEFHQLVPHVLAENGCIEYGPTIDASTDLDRQHVNENLVTIIERWESLEDLKAHLAAPHMAAYRERVKDLIVDARLQVLRAA